MKKVNKSKFKIYARRAYKGQNDMDANCSEIYHLVKPFIEKSIIEEAHVFIQDGDGLCLSWHSRSWAGVSNTPIVSVIEMINDVDKVLNEEDLLSISI